MFLLQKDCDIPVAAVMGDYRQASPSFVSHEAAGTQCASISLIGIIAATRVPPSRWKKQDINNILEEGNKLHENVLCELDWPNNPRDPRLNVDELPDHVLLSFRGEELDVSIGLLDGSTGNPRKSAHSKIRPWAGSRKKSPKMRPWASFLYLRCEMCQEFPQ